MDPMASYTGGAGGSYSSMYPYRRVDAYELRGVRIQNFQVYDSQNVAVYLNNGETVLMSVGEFSKVNNRMESYYEPQTDSYKARVMGDWNTTLVDNSSTQYPSQPGSMSAPSPVAKPKETPPPARNSIRAVYFRKHLHKKS